MSNLIRTSVRAERTGEKEGELSKVITYKNGAEVSLPINKDVVLNGLMILYSRGSHSNAIRANGFS